MANRPRPNSPTWKTHSDRGGVGTWWRIYDFWKCIFMWLWQFWFNTRWYWFNNPCPHHAHWNPCNGEGDWKITNEIRISYHRIKVVEINYNTPTIMKKTAEEIYKAVGEGYGYNGSKEDCIKVIEEILRSQASELPSEMPEWFTFRGHTSDEQLWNEIVKRFGISHQKRWSSVEELVVKRLQIFMCLLGMKEN